MFCVDCWKIGGRVGVWEKDGLLFRMIVCRVQDGRRCRNINHIYLVFVLIFSSEIFEFFKTILMFLIIKSQKQFYY